jgi:hypothetical protein
MGITKQQLKTIVKECLVEILAEGIGPSTKDSIQEAVARTQKPVEKSTSLPRRGENVKYNQAIAETIKRESKGNSVMESIFADTAMNTLPTMMNENARQQPLPPAGSAEGVIARSTPEELFGDEAASKWAQLAFSETPKKF